LGRLAIGEVANQAFWKFLKKTLKKNPKPLAYIPMVGLLKVMTMRK
jgi:hypothetical protein